MILVHQYPKSLRLLIDALVCDSSYFMIHVDKKNDQNEFKLCLSDLDDQRVKFVHNRISCAWGDISLVDAEIVLMKCAFSFLSDQDNLEDINFILISGEDIPLHKNEILEKRLMDLSHHSRLAIWALPYDQWWGGGTFRVERPHIFNKKNRRKWNDRLNLWLGFVVKSLSPSFRLSRYFNGFRFYGGQQWFVFNGNAVKGMLDFIEKNPRYRSVFEYAFAPDELFFHTLFMNLASLYHWEYSSLPTHYVRFNANDANPDYLKSDDLISLSDKSNYLFARKYRYESA